VRTLGTFPSYGIVVGVRGSMYAQCWCLSCHLRCLPPRSYSTLFPRTSRHLKWIIKGVERLETLVSISTDGRVLEWNLKKGLVVSNLMQLKKSGTVSTGCIC
jgi:hypothetical protein